MVKNSDENDARKEFCFISQTLLTVPEFLGFFNQCISPWHGVNIDGPPSQTREHSAFQRRRM